jgi:hypothetical protein
VTEEDRDNPGPLKIGSSVGLSRNTALILDELKTCCVVVIYYHSKLMWSKLLGYPTY